MPAIAVVERPWWLVAEDDNVVPLSVPVPEVPPLLPTDEVAVEVLLAVPVDLPDTVETGDPETAVEDPLVEEPSASAWVMGFPPSSTLMMVFVVWLALLVPDPEINEPLASVPVTVGVPEELEDDWTAVSDSDPEPWDAEVFDGSREVTVEDTVTVGDDPASTLLLPLPPRKMRPR